MSQFFKTLKIQGQPFKVYLGVMLLLAGIIALTTVLSTYVTGEMAEAAVAQNTHLLVNLIGFMTVVFAIRALAAALRALILWRYAASASYRFRDNFAKFFLRRPFAQLEEANSGESVSVYSQDLPMAVQLVSTSGMGMATDFITLVVSVVYLFMVSVSLSIIYFAAFPVLIVLQGVISKPIQTKQVKSSEADAAFIAVINDSFQNTATISAYGLEDVMEKRCRNAFRDVIKTTKAFFWAMIPLVAAGLLASFTPLLIVIAIAGGRVVSGDLNFAEFVVFIGLAGEAGTWISMLSQRLTDVQTHAGGAKRLLTTMEGVHKVEENLSTGAALQHAGDIVLEAKDLTFSYPTATERKALDGISFHIKKGSRVAFVGGSGSGKSTVLKLLLGLYQPTGGGLTVLGQSTGEASLDALRKAFAYVPQDCFLFPTSIAANIMGGETTMDMARLEKACADAGVLDFIRTLPEQFDAVLNEEADNISGGQKQRIALARAFYRNASIILFDEATSALDPTTEAAVLKSFHTVAADKTVVMVSHRIQPISFCDTIIVMDQGKIAAIGDHQTLLAQCTIYQNLYQAQSSEVAHD